MNTLYEVNGLVFWSSEEIKFRNYIKEAFADKIKAILTAEHKGWNFFEIEAPVLIPSDLINKNYGDQDVWVQQPSGMKEIFAGDRHSLVLRPETTPELIHIRTALDK